MIRERRQIRDRLETAGREIAAGESVIRTEAYRIPVFASNEDWPELRSSSFCSRTSEAGLTEERVVRGI